MKHIEIKTKYGNIDVYNSKMYDKVPINDICSNKCVLEDSGHVMSTEVMSCYNLLTPSTTRIVIATVNVKRGETVSIIADGNDKIIDFDYLNMLYKASNTASFVIDFDDIKFMVYFNFGRMQVELQSKNKAYLTDLQLNKEASKQPNYIVSTLGMII